MSLEEAHARLARFGFLLLDHRHPDGQPSQLLVGMRPLPTYAHFDPEAVTFWRTDAEGRGRLDLLTVDSHDRATTRSRGEPSASSTGSASRTSS